MLYEAPEIFQLNGRLVCWFLVENANQRHHNYLSSPAMLGEQCPISCITIIAHKFRESFHCGLGLGSLREESAKGPILAVTCTEPPPSVNSNTKWHGFPETADKLQCHCKFYHEVTRLASIQIAVIPCKNYMYIPTRDYLFNITHLCLPGVLK